MSKNLTRKGLAFGAVLALGSTLITATSASAVEAVSLEAAEGTTYNVPLASGFTLKSLFTDAAQQGAEAVKFRVVDTANKLDVSGAGAAADASGYSNAYSAATNLPTQADITEITDADSDGVFFVAGSTSVAPTASYLFLKPGSSTTSFSVTAQAFMDLDGDNVIDAGEAASEVRTINFVATADITGTSVVDSYGLGDTKITASVKTTPVLNGAQLSDASNVASGAVAGKVTNAVSSTVYDSTQTKWDETNQEWDVTTTLPSFTPSAAAATTNVVTLTKATAHGLLTGDTIRVSGLTVDTDANITAAVASVPTTTTLTYSAANVATVADLGVAGTPVAQVVVGSGAYTFKPYFSTTEIGSGVSSSTGAATAASGATSSTNTADQSFSVSSGNTTIVARTGKTVTANYTVKDADKALVSGKQVRIAVSGVTGTLKVNGATTAVANGDVINAVTNSSGQVSVSIASTSAAATDAITLTFVAEAVSATSKTVAVTWDDAVYYIVDLADTAAINNNTANRAAAKGSSVNFNLSVVDQWRQAIDGAKYRLKVAATTRTVWTKFVSISGGKASFSVEDGALTAGTTGVAISFQKLASGTWSDIEGAAADAEGYDWGNSEDSSVTITYYDQTDAVSVTTPTAQVRTADETAAVDGRTSAAAAFSTTSNAVTLAGDVKNSVTGALKVGAVVTVSGSSDILFQVGGVSAFGSITFVSADGNYSVAAYSNKVATDSVVTIASGSASKTAKVSFTASTDRADITQVKVTGSISAIAGRTSVLTYATADKFGNAVKTATNVAVTNYGPGYLTAYPTAFGSDGTFTVVLITGVADSGLADVKVVADGATTATTDDLTVNTTGLVGAAAVPAATAAISGSTGKVYASVSNAAGKTVVVKINGVTKKTFAGTLAKKTVVVYSTAGAKNVSVFVGGSRVATKVVTIK